MNQTKHRFTKTSYFTQITFVVLLGTGCTAYASPTANDTPKEALPADANKISPMMNKEDQVLFARKDLAKRLDLDLEYVTLSGASKVTWRSGALGCPEDGKMYTQALVPGVLIMLKVEHTPYRYHAKPTGVPFYCSDDRAESPSYNSSDI